MYGYEYHLASSCFALYSLTLAISHGYLVNIQNEYDTLLLKVWEYNDPYNIALLALASYEIQDYQNFDLLSDKLLEIHNISLETIDDYSKGVYGSSSTINAAGPNHDVINVETTLLSLLVWSKSNSTKYLRNSEIGLRYALTKGAPTLTLLSHILTMHILQLPNFNMHSEIRYNDKTADC